MKVTIIFFIFISFTLNAVETCGRTATINYQEVLIDTSTNKKGEGLRYYLEKDPEALSYLNEYQENNNYFWYTTPFSTLGTMSILWGLVMPNKTDPSIWQKKETYFVAGGILILASYMAAKLIESHNKQYLDKAVEEYNKRNTPQIFFSPQVNLKSKKYEDHSYEIAAFFTSTF